MTPRSRQHFRNYADHNCFITTLFINWFCAPLELVCLRFFLLPLRFFYRPDFARAVVSHSTAISRHEKVFSVKFGRAHGTSISRWIQSISQTQCPHRKQFCLFTSLDPTHLLCCLWNVIRMHSLYVWQLWKSSTAAWKSLWKLLDISWANQSHEISVGGNDLFR